VCEAELVLIEEAVLFEVSGGLLPVNCVFELVSQHGYLLIFQMNLIFGMYNQPI
jgi:hypothetical protein